jgi:hypothetical protein
VEESEESEESDNHRKLMTRRISCTTCLRIQNIRPGQQQKTWSLGRESREGSAGHSPARKQFRVEGKHPKDARSSCLSLPRPRGELDQHRLCPRCAPTR